jgi:phosphoglycerol transferase
VVVGVAALWDGTSPSNRPNYEAITAQWNTDQQFVDGIDATLPKGGQVLQLPMQPFPEAGGIVEMGDYEHLVGYVHSDGLRWSYGAMKGRPADWTRAAADLPPDQLLYAAAAAGFGGVWIDRAGYEDKAAELERQVQRLTGASGPTVESGDGRRVFYDLQPLARQLQASVPAADRTELKAALITPVVAQYGEGFYGPEKDEETDWRWALNDAVMRIENGTGRPQKVRWTAGLRSAVGSRTTVSVDGKVVQEASFPAPEAEPRVNLQLTVPPEGVEVRFRTSGANLGPPSGDPRALYLKLMEPRLVNETFERAQRALARGTATR